MTLSEASVRRVWRYLLALGLASGLLASLAACGTAPLSDGSDIVTTSDEPEFRRRARIRLQLAVSYFEQGQTTVALDEVKQALNADPNFADAFSLRGLIYMRLNEMRLAEDSFQRALSIKPNDGNVLHNLGWLQCQQGKYTEAMRSFMQALSNPTYGERAKTLLTQGLCQSRAGQTDEAIQSLSKAYELDAGNPVTGYNLASLLHKQGDYVRAQFYIRRINNSELANAETYWLGIKIEHRLGNRVARDQLATQLRNRYPKSKELNSYERGAFHE